MPGLACQGSSIHPDMHTDMQGRHAQGHTGRRGHASRMRRLRADGALGNWKGATSLAADGGKGKSRGYVLAVLLTAIPFREIVEVHTITIRVDAPHQSYQKLLDSG